MVIKSIKYCCSPSKWHFFMALAYWDDPPSRAHVTFCSFQGASNKATEGARWAPSRVLNVVMGAENKWVTGVLRPLLITGDGAHLVVLLHVAQPLKVNNQLSAGLDVSLFGGIGHFKIH